MQKQTTEELVRNILQVTTGIREGTKDGETFWVVDGWESISNFMYSLTEHIAGVALTENYYKNRLYHGDLMDARNTPRDTVPEEIKEAYDFMDLPMEFEDIIPGDWGFSDSFSRCHHCGEVVQTRLNPGRRAKYVTFKAELICQSCLLADLELFEEYLEHIEGDHRRILGLAGVEEALRELGWEKEHEAWGRPEPKIYNSSLHETKTQDDPSEVMEVLTHQHDAALFHIYHSTEFGIEWIAWVKND